MIECQNIVLNVVRKFSLNNFKKIVNGSKILVLGVAYKQDIDDYRESPAIESLNELENLVQKLNILTHIYLKYKEHGKHVKKGLNELTKKKLTDADLVISYYSTY